MPPKAVNANLSRVPLDIWYTSELLDCVVFGFKVKTKVIFWKKCAGVHAAAARGSRERREHRERRAQTAVQLCGMSPLQFPSARKEASRLPHWQSGCWAAEGFQDQVRETWPMLCSSCLRGHSTNTVFTQVTVFRQRSASLHQTTARCSAGEDGGRSKDGWGNVSALLLVASRLTPFQNVHFFWEQNKIKVVALKITNNINVLIKVRWCSTHTHTPTHTCFETQLWFLCLIQDLFHNPPSFKSTVTLSWKPVQKAEALVYVCLCGSGLTETFRSWRFLLSAEPSVHPLTRWILGPPQRSPFLLSLEGMPGRYTTPPVASTAPPLATSTMVRNALWHRRRHDLLLQVTCSCNIRPLLNTYKMVSFVFLGSNAFICYLGCDITKMVFDFCVQNNVEASGAAEDEVLAPGEVEAGAVSIEPLAAGRMASHQHRLLIFFIFLMFSRPPDPPADYYQGGFWLRLLTLSFTSSSGPIHPDWF